MTPLNNRMKLLSTLNEAADPAWKVEVTFSADDDFVKEWKSQALESPRGLYELKALKVA